MELGSLYRLISRLLDRAFIEEAPDVDHPSHAGRPRRSYRLTALGRATLEAETRRLRELVRIAEATLLPDPAGR